MSETVQENETAIYELGYHMAPTIAEEALPAEVGELKASLEERGAVFITEEFPRKVGLAYPITKPVGGKRETFSSAYFGWVKFELPSEALSAVREAVKRRPTVLRSLLVETVRENTLAPKRLAMFREPEGHARPERREAPKPVMTDEELDRTIEKLVKE